MDRIPIELESFHHIYNRGTDKRTVFTNVSDYKRFVFYLNVVNDTEIASPTHTRVELEEENPIISMERLVNLIAFCHRL